MITYSCSFCRGRFDTDGLRPVRNCPYCESTLVNIVRVVR